MPKISSIVCLLAVSADGKNAGSTSVDAVAGVAGVAGAAAGVSGTEAFPLGENEPGLNEDAPVGMTAAIEPEAELGEPVSESEESPPFLNSSEANWSDLATSGAVGFTPIAITKPIKQGKAKAAPTKERSHTGGRGVESTERSIAAIMREVGFEVAFDMMAKRLK